MDNTSKLVEIDHVKEKLIVLVNAARDARTGQDLAERIADHLITNGVTIPVRCKDCKHMKTTKVPPIPSYCKKHNKMPVSGDDYCSFGERNTDAENH